MSELQPIPRAQDDLAGQAPGHALLAKIAEDHAKAVDVDGMPGSLDDDVTSWCVGYVGEEQVGAVLATLPAGWRVLHAVPVGATADVDHVLIGPPGVVVVNTKHRPGQRLTAGRHTIFAAGQKTSYLRDIRRDAAYATAALGGLPVPVHPAICIVGATRLRRADPAPDVTVVDVHLLVAALTTLPAVVAPDQVEAAYERLRRASSWTSRPPVPAAPPWVAEYARALAKEERIAHRGHRQAPTPEPAAHGSRRRRRRWFELATAGLVLGAMVAAILLLPVLLRLIEQLGTGAVRPPAPARAGQVCTVKGQQLTVGSTRLTCQKVKNGTELRWRPAG